MSDSRAEISDDIFEYVQRCAKHRTDPERDEHGACPYGPHAKALAIVAERPWPNPPDSLTAAEALYGFMAHLTTLPGSHTFGAAHDTSSYAARLIGEYCKANNLAAPAEDYHVRLKFPSRHHPHHHIMSEPLPPELFGVPGHLNEWLSPADEVATMERIDDIAKDIDHAGFPDSHEDGLWLAQTCRKLLEARIATRSAVVKMSQDLAAYEQGQGILGASLHLTKP